MYRIGIEPTLGEFKGRLRYRDEPFRAEGRGEDWRLQQDSNL